MTSRTRRIRSCIETMLTMSVVLLSVGCGPSRVDRQRLSPYPRPQNFAIVPFRNLSGSADVDMMAVTDEFYSELQQVEGIDVIPVNQVLATLVRLKLERVGQPDDVYLLAEALDVDGVVVGSVTQYDPYPPPLMGMAVQLYLREDRPNAEAMTYVNPGEITRAGRTFQMGRAKLVRPTAMAVRIFDSRQDDVVERIKSYAASRGAPKTPYDWRRYTTRRNYLRFVSYEMIGELFAREQERMGTQPQVDE